MIHTTVVVCLRGTAKSEVPVEHILFERRGVVHVRRIALQLEDVLLDAAKRWVLVRHVCEEKQEQVERGTDREEGKS